MQPLKHDNVMIFHKVDKLCLKGPKSDSHLSLIKRMKSDDRRTSKIAPPNAECGHCTGRRGVIFGRNAG